MIQPYEARRMDDHRGLSSKRTAIADANAEKQKVEKERDELREALDIIEAHLGTSTRQYASEDGT